MSEQLDFGWNTGFLEELVEQSRTIIRACAEQTDKPLVIQYSGGKDSQTLVSMVREVTDYFVCCYMYTGLEFKENLDFVKNTCNKLGLPLLVSFPSMHKGDFFERLAKFRYFPNISSGGNSGGPNSTWCNRDLKLRPQKKMLQRLFGKGKFFKLEGIRMFESIRRRSIYRNFRKSLMRPDGEHKGSWEVFPLMNFTDQDILNYIKKKGLDVQSGYKKYGVTGCAWCPFYGSDIYLKVLADDPHYYDRFIEWEDRLGKPSVVGQVYLRDLKKQVLDGTL